MGYSPWCRKELDMTERPHYDKDQKTTIGMPDLAGAFFFFFGHKGSLDTTMSICLYIANTCFPTIMAELSSCQRDHKI